MHDRDNIGMKLFNGAVFQALWLLLVVTAGSRGSGVVVGATGLVVLLQLRLTTPRTFKSGLIFVLLATVSGAVMETLLTWAGVFSPLRAIAPFPLTPLWLIGLWLAFAGFLKTTLTYLRGRPVTQWCLGAIGGPMAYWSGARLGAVDLHLSLPLALGALALAWGGRMRPAFQASGAS